MGPWLAARRPIWSPIAIIAAAAAAALSAAFIWGPPLTESAPYNLSWTAQIAEGMRQGDPYPRWLPGSFEGLGSPTFFFYPPLVFMIAGALNAAGLTTAAALNTTSLILLFGSGLSMYLWLRARRWRALPGALIYMLAPYHFSDLYHRCDLAESGAFVWLPLIALGIDLLPRRKGLVILAVSWAGLLLTHLPTAVLASAFLIVPLAAQKVWQTRAALLPGVAAALLGLGLASIYLLPAMTLQQHVNMQLLWTERYQPARLFDPEERASLVALSTLVPGALAAAILSLQARSILTAIAYFAVLAAFGLLPIWEAPLLDKVQFSWRLLAIVEFAGAAAFAAAPTKPVIAIAAGALAFPTYLIGIKLVVDALPTPPAQIEHVLTTLPEAPEYLPRGADLSGLSDMQRNPNLALYRGLHSATHNVAVASPSIVTLHRAAFPIWRVEKGGTPVASSGPLIRFRATAGIYRLRRVSLWQENFGATISALSALVLAMVGILGVRRAAVGGRDTSGQDDLSVETHAQAPTTGPSKLE